jgi:hypothetical protein
MSRLTTIPIGSKKKFKPTRYFIILGIDYWEELEDGELKSIIVFNP